MAIRCMINIYEKLQKGKKQIGREADPAAGLDSFLIYHMIRHPLTWSTVYHSGGRG